MILWFYDFMILWFYEKWGSLNNWQSLRPITLWGSVKKNQNWSIIKGWQGVQRDLVQTTFLSEWQGGTVRDMTCKRCLWPGVAPSHKPCEQYIHWMEKTGSHFELAYHQIAHCTYSLNLYLLAYCLSIRLAPITHFLLNLLTRSSCHLHCILSSAHIVTHIGSCTLHF